MGGTQRSSTSVAIGNDTTALDSGTQAIIGAGGDAFVDLVTSVSPLGGAFLAGNAATSTRFDRLTVPLLGSATTDVAVGRINGDAYDDAVFIAYTTGRIAVYLGDGSGGFELVQTPTVQSAQRR